jgi:membrane protease YdiL (CAAX protease family)
MENLIPSSDGSSTIPAVRPAPRFTWYTLGFVVVILFLAVLGRHVPHQKPVPPRFIFQLFVLIVQWLFFFAACRGIRSAGMRFRDVLGDPWSSTTQFWKDFKLAVIVILAVYLATYLLMYVSPFQPYPVGRATTGLQYFMSLLVAFSAGFTEEVIFRGLLFSQFYLLTSNMVAAVVGQAILFSVAHGGNQSATQFLKHFFSGCLFASVAIIRKSLWPAILAHVLLDVTAFTVIFLAVKWKLGSP